MPTGATLPRPALVLVTDRHRAAARGRPIVDVVSGAVAGGVDIVQLREKDLGTDELIALARRVLATIAGRALFFVNGDIDAAAAVGADGVHLPAGAALVRAARRRLGGRALISVAAHGLEEARRAAADGADIVQLGTAFASASHPGVTPLGTAGVRDICAAINAPVIAIGGITASNAGALVAAGVAGVAVIGAIVDAPESRAAARALRDAIGAGTPSR